MPKSRLFELGGEGDLPVLHSGADGAVVSLGDRARDGKADAKAAAFPVRVGAGAVAHGLRRYDKNSTADTASNVTFTFTDSGVTAAGETDTGYEIDGTALTITSSGTYTVSGSCADGSIKVKKGTTGVTLVLDGLTLTSENTAAITCGKSSEVTILVSNGTENSLSDTEQNNDDNYPENENAENAVIKCKDGSLVTLCGDGELTITANGKNGIKSGATTDEDGEASLTIRDLTLNIDAPVNDAINAEQLLNVESGTLTIDAADDAIHCDLVLNISADGTDGPTIDITNCCEGLEGAELNVCSGDITINASDDCLNAANSDLTDYDFTMTISGGTIDACSSAGDGFDSNGDLTITGDTVIVWTANTADNEPLDADGTITVSGGTVLAAGGSSGMGMGGGFPGGGQKPDGEPPESFDGQMPNGEKSELPDGEVPEMPSGERLTPPSGQGSPADGNAPAGDSTSDTTPTA